jgi:hypothetical protein
LRLIVSSSISLPTLDTAAGPTHDVFDQLKITRFGSSPMQTAPSQCSGPKFWSLAMSLFLFDETGAVAVARLNP